MRSTTLATITSAAVLILAAGAAQGEEGAPRVPDRPTFTKDVLPILQEKCQGCHRPGGNTIAGIGAPMSLITYEEVRPWAKSMAKKVESREMPPWDATDASKGHFVNERTLEPWQIETIVKWTASGTRRGNPGDAPPPLEPPDDDGWVIGIPDLEIYLEEPYWVADDVVDIQPYFTIEITEEMLPEPRWIKAAECRPRSPIVHHTFSTIHAVAIEGHPEETYPLVSAAAGEDPQQYPDGFGNLLRPGSTLHISMHYNKEAGDGTGMWDQSGVGIKFYPKGAEVKHKVNWGSVGDLGRANTIFEIPPRHPNWKVGWSGTYEDDTLLLSLHPHMHYRGKDMKYTAYYPDGTVEELINVDRFDFGWQTIYFYNEPKFLPAGTRVDVIAHYDNSDTIKAVQGKLNIERPVGYGAASEDEMMIPYASWTHADPEKGREYRIKRMEARRERLQARREQAERESADQSSD